MSRSEHLEWCKKRALEYLDESEVTNAWASMCSDLQKHEETRDHPAIMLGMGLLLMGDLKTVLKMREFINGFN